jgi:hypothetical protein
MKLAAIPCAPIPLQPRPESGKLRKRSTVSDVARHLSGLWRRILCWTIAYALVLQPALAPVFMSSLGVPGADQDGAVALVLCLHDSDTGGLPSQAPGTDTLCKLCLGCGPAPPLVPDLSPGPARSLTPTPVRFAFVPATIPPSPRLPYQRSRGPPRVA